METSIDTDNDHMSLNIDIKLFGMCYILQYIIIIMVMIMEVEEEMVGG